jgi:hypothetical protein
MNFRAPLAIALLASVPALADEPPLREICETAAKNPSQLWRWADNEALAEQWPNVFRTRDEIDRLKENEPNPFRRDILTDKASRILRATADHINHYLNSPQRITISASPYQERRLLRLPNPMLYGEDEETIFYDHSPAKTGTWKGCIAVGGDTLPSVHQALQRPILERSDLGERPFARRSLWELYFQKGMVLTDPGTNTGIPLHQYLQQETAADVEASSGSGSRRHALANGRRIDASEKLDPITPYNTLIPGLQPWNRYGRVHHSFDEARLVELINTAGTRGGGSCTKNQPCHFAIWVHPWVLDWMIQRHYDFVMASSTTDDPDKHYNRWGWTP